MICANFDKEALKNAHISPESFMQGETQLDTLENECVAIFEKYKDVSVSLARAYMIKHILEKARIFFCNDELFVCGIENRNITGRVRYEALLAFMNEKYPESLELNKLGYESGAFTADPDFGHNCPDYETLFSLGIGGIIDDAKRRMEGFEENSYEYNTLLSTVIVYEALQAHIDRYIDLCLAHKDENENCALRYETLVSIRNAPPKNICEALQLQMLVFYTIYNVTENFARTLGVLDGLLYRFYKNDIESGRFSKDDVRAILSNCFYRYYTMRVTANTPFCICGVDKDGKDASNELTMLMLEQYHSLDINDPKIQVRWHEDLPNEITQFVLKSIRDGRNSFVFLNDSVVIPSLEKLGATREDAQNYVPVGCYEPLCAGKEIAATCAGRVMLPKACEYVFSSGYDLKIQKQVGKATKPIDKIESFDEFYALVKEQICHLVDISVNVCRDFELLYPCVSSSPVFNPLLGGCFENGRVKEAYDSGAKYNNTSINAFGIATVANELAVIKKAVFEEKRLTLCELFDILKNNWQDNEKLRIEFLTKYPKYGNGNDYVDSFAADIMKFCASKINGRENGRGGKFRLGAFSIDWCFTFGRNLLASADGRFDGDTMSKNMCATTATDKGGATSLIRSVTRIDYTDTPNGTVLDLALHKSALSGDDGIAGACALVGAYMKMGGFAIQINAFDPKILRMAQKTPEKYKTLQVRRCGWNVYFNELSREEQNEFIKQAENA